MTPGRSITAVLGCALLFSAGDFASAHAQVCERDGYVRGSCRASERDDAGCCPGPSEGVGGSSTGGVSSRAERSGGSSAHGGTSSGSSRRRHREPESTMVYGAMVSIPAGSYWMGSPAGVGEADEHPTTRVTVDAFELDQVEVTVAAYRECVDAGACAPLAPGGDGECNTGRSGREHHPVNCVTWDEAQAFCLSAGKRLPTEAEWEYAARGTDGRTYPWGNDEPGEPLLRWSGSREVTGTARVGAFPAGASPFGALDLAGNLSEWTADWHGGYRGASVTNPAGADHGTYRVYRGGGWGLTEAVGVRAAHRSGTTPSDRRMDLGFRCALGGSSGERRAAQFRIALSSYRSEDWAGTVRDMGAFIERFGSDSAAVEEVVEAAWHIYEAREAAGSSATDILAALRAVVDHYTRLGGTRRSMAAEYAAHARFILAEPTLTAFEPFVFDPGHPATLEAYVGAHGTLLTQLRAGGAEASRVGAEYEPVVAYGRPVWTVAALVRQGRAYEILASAFLNAPFVMPEDLARQIRSASTEVREEIRIQVEDRLRQACEPEVRVVECFAVYRYVLATRAARAASIDNEYTRTAIDRLHVYGDERIAECIQLMISGDSPHGITADPTIPVYTAGEFERARRGEP